MPDRDTETYQDFLKDFQPGASLGTRYKIIKAIGSGGMGRVFLAHDLELDSDVALKVIRPELLQSEKALERFKNELLVARKVSHKNVVRIHDIGEINGLKYLTMTYIGGKSLKELLAGSGALEAGRAIAIFTQICEGVAAAHEEGVIHRDLKPANVMLEENDRVYITDFGIARLIDGPDQTQTGIILGTPAYLSPEQTWGERPDTRSDIYSLGLILYEMLTGELPFDHETAGAFKTRLPADLERRLKNRKPQPPPYIVAIARKCLDPGRSSRYQTVPAILNDLRSRKVSKRLPLREVGVVVLLILVTAFAAYEYANRARSAPPGQPHATAPRSVSSAVILPFENKTGTKDMDWIESTMVDLLISDLSQAGNLRIVSQDRTVQTLQDLKIPAGAYTDDVVKRISDVLDADLVIQGSLTKAGSSLRADLQLTDAKDAHKTAYFKATGNKQDDLLPMVDRLAQQVQEHLATTSAAPASAANVSTQSIPALKAFHQGVEQFRSGDPAAAVESLNETIRLDPRFVKAYLKLSETYEAMRREKDAVDILQKAIAIRDSKDEKTMDLIRARHYLLTGETEQAIKTYQAISKKYPTDPEMLSTLAQVYEETGDLKNAAIALEKVIALDPNDADAYFHLGKDMILMGNSEKAIGKYLIKALSLETQRNNRYGQADVLNAMGVAYERMGRYNDAIKYYGDAHAMKQEIGNKKGAATSLTNIAKIYIFQGEYDKAKTILNQTLAAYQEINEPEGVSEIMNTFGVIDENQGHYEEALKHYKNALQIRKQLQDDALTAESYDNIGQIHYLMAQYDEAQVYWDQALALKKKAGDESGIIVSMQNIGFLQMAQGDLDKALKSFLEALNQSRAIQFENAVPVSLGNLGTIYQKQGRYDAALDSYREAIAVLDKLKDKRGQAEYTKLMGSTFLDMQNMDAARGQLAAALKLSQEIGSDEIIADVFVLTSRLDRLKGDFDSAAKDIEEANQHASGNKYQKGLLAAKIENGLLLLAQNHAEESGRTLKAAVQESKELGDIWLSLDSQYALASLYQATGDSKKAAALCAEGIRQADRMGLKPYLDKFHSLESALK